MDHRLSTIAGSRAAKELASSGGRFTLGAFAFGIIRAMELTTILKICRLKPVDSYATESRGAAEAA
jgi:hypothetical protein